ncbi:unnamed protein product [Phaedon cochleariae]|uniref:Uncharacterized protein n=1 Tax=Phaedon cochleariae TaxID=80249 RepID=A0A9N9WY76_PHACE|nr:unnamed protein product [Phaedon cochleariae]
MSTKITRSQTRNHQITNKNSKSRSTIENPNSDHNEDEKFRTLSEEIENLKKALEEKEIEGEYMISLLKQEISNLKTDNQGKDKHIIQLKRRSQDFEEDVFETEKSFSIESQRQRRTILELNEEIAKPTDEIILLQEKNDEAVVKLRESEKNIDEWKAMRKIMLKSIETLTQENNSYIDQLKSMRNVKQLSQEEPKNQANNNETKQAVEQKKIIRNQMVHSRKPHEKVKTKILVVAGYQGRDIAKNLYNILSDTCSVQAILKPNANDDVLIETALNNSRNFSDSDVVILWPNKCDKNIIEKFVMKLKHTQPLIITEAYRYDYTYENENIYYRNLDLFQKVYKLGLNKCPIIECNNIINRSCYKLDRVSLNFKGKLFLTIDDIHGKNRILLLSLATSSEAPSFFKDDMYLFFALLNQALIASSEDFLFADNPLT